MNWIRAAVLRPLLAITLLFLLTSVAAEGVTPDAVINVVGTGDIYSDNVSAGREQAIADCLVSAVSRVVEDLIPENTIVRRFQLLNETVYSNPKAFIRDYKVLTESTVGKKYRVLVQATVIKTQLAGRLAENGILISEKTYPKILLFIAEQGVPDMEPRGWWGPAPDADGSISTTAVDDVLAFQGYTVLNPAMLQDAATLSVRISDQEALLAGKKLSADIVIIGSARAGIASNVMEGDIKSYTGSVSAYALRTDTGDQIAMTQRSFTAKGIDDIEGNSASLSKAGNLVGEDLAAQISAVWLNSASTPKFVEITVEGTGGNIAHFVRFRGRLNEMSHVNGIQLKEMMQDSAVLLVDFQGDAKTLAEELLETNFGVFGINIYEINPHSLKLKLTLN